jgi:hypothetical protein
VGDLAVDTIGYYIMIALLGAGAAYGLANRGKPKPALSSSRKKAVIICATVVVGCGLLALAVGLMAQNTVPH